MQSSQRLPSFKAVFERDFRLRGLPWYREGKLPIPVPGGLKYETIGYFLAINAAIFIVSKIPLVGGVIADFPVTMRVVILPAVAAGLLTMVELDGRPFYKGAFVVLVSKLLPRSTSGSQQVEESDRDYVVGIRCAVAPDARAAARMNIGGQFVGPGVVEFRNGKVTTKRKWLELRPAQSDSDGSVSLASHEVLRVRNGA